MIISKITPLNNYKQTCKNKPALNLDNSSVSFQGGFKEPKFLTKFIDKIAGGYVKMLESKAGQKIINATENHPKYKKNYFAHLIVLGSTLLSGMYVIKTMNNKNLDSEKRQTLAINQGIVYVVSTIMAYTFDKMLNKKTEHTIGKFKSLNTELKKVNPEKFAQCVEGIKKGKSIVVIDSVYRFLAPVAVTPLANHIGNKINDKKTAKNATLNKQA
jgi:hypothetical protein